jgi:site-specific DNA-methyltransferase (adenine-specific)
MRQLVRASLPFGEGIVLDPFMGSGSTIAAAVRLGYASLGVELDECYFQLANKAIPKLVRLEAMRGDRALTAIRQASLFV